MTERPSDRAIAQAFEVELAKLPAGAQQNIRDAMARDESLSWEMFRAGWLAAAPDGANGQDAKDLRNMAAHFDQRASLCDPKWKMHHVWSRYRDLCNRLNAAPPSQVDEDAARLDFIESKRFDVCPLEGGGFDVYRYREGSNETILVASGATARAAIDAARAARGGG